MRSLVPFLDQKREQVEISGNEWLLSSITQQNPAARREDERSEAIARH
jgi:hypothetical protein